MIYFFADNHYGAHPGKLIYSNLSAALKKEIIFKEDDWSLLESGEWVDSCDLLILNMIGGTCDIAHPGNGAQKAVRKYCERGGNILLLHGSSAAFWQWKWWREIVGLRWVRPGDPDKQETSTHPHAPCKVELIKSRHKLIKKLKAFELPEDEIYTELEETAPVMNLMAVHMNDSTYVQCCETITPWKGLIVSFIPGHKYECTTNPDLIYNVKVLIKYLLNR